VNRARWHAIDLQPESDDEWTGLEPSARRAIRRSQRDNVVVSHAESLAELRIFYELHMGIRKRKYRLLAQPYAFFENLWREFVAADKGTLMLARVGEEVAAGVLFLEWKDTLYYKFNASDPMLSACRPNDAIMWAAMEYGRKRGHRRIDLGLSDWDQEGLVRYKRKYASEEKTISFLSNETPGATATGPSRLGQLMPRLTDLLTDERVPDAITERAGAVLYRYFA
jgi:lipid II:glycine glycyltransferase (peptidoglycan interpeptide bridge formation enzyme)